MCGIAGIVGPRAMAGDSVDRAIAALRHRGPDGAGVWRDPTAGIALGHTRLAIVDLERGGQPLFNEDRTVAVVFNGEIYNHLELRTELERRGHRFQTACDTEVLVHLYEEVGTGMFERLLGMFALAIWDARARRLVLARDRLGKKPLYFAREAGGLAFASEIKALRPLLRSTPAIDPAAIDDFLTLQYTPGDRSGFVGIEKLPPGSWLEATGGRIEVAPYWTAPETVETFAGDFEEAAGELRRLLKDAVRIRLRADVPVGVLLSGGLDSSVVAALAAEATGGPLRTFTAHFAGHGSDERPVARAVAQRFATRHEELEIAPPAVDLIGRIVGHFDEPFADTSAVPTFQLCAFARRSVKVALTGDGGDESLLGYDRYPRLADYVRGRRRFGPILEGTGLAALGRSICPNPGRRTWRRRLRTLSNWYAAPPESAYVGMIAAFFGPLKARLVRPELTRWRQGPDIEERIARELRERFRRDWPAAAAAYDLVHYLPGAVLAKVDRASMAHGLECRCPFLDHRVVEFLASLPTSWKLHPRQGGKWILRQAFADLLPREVFEHPKTGFGAPVGRWLLAGGRTAMDAACLPTATLAEWVDRAVVAELLGEHESGAVDHTYRLWTLACLKRFAVTEGIG